MRMKKTVVKVSERGGSKREKCFTAMYSFNSGIRLVLVLEDKFESLTAIYLRVIVRENRAGAKDGGPPISTKFSAIKDYPIG